MKEPPKYICPDRVSSALRSLSKRRPVVGNNKEETSALLYFFSAAASAYECGKTIVDGLNLCPKIAKRERDTFLRFFRIFAQIGRSSKIISELGVLSISGKTADYVVRSNFLSTIVDRASKGPVNGTFYPSRPRCGQVFVVGTEVYGSRMSVKLHPSWKNGLRTLMAGRESKTPWTDLCVVLFRSYLVDSTHINLTSFLIDRTEVLFDSEVSSFLSKCLKSEEKFIVTSVWLAEVGSRDPLELSEPAKDIGNSPLEAAQMRIKRLEEFILSKGFDPDIVK